MHTYFNCFVQKVCVCVCVGVCVHAHMCEWVCAWVCLCDCKSGEASIVVCGSIMWALYQPVRTTLSLTNKGPTNWRLHYTLHCIPLQVCFFDIKKQYMCCISSGNPSKHMWILLLLMSQQESPAHAYILCIYTTIIP